MQEIRKASYQATDMSLFVPSLADQLDAQEASHAHREKAPWQPRWTILFSLTAGVALWGVIVWLVRF